jgi:hypothetical protein
MISSRDIEYGKNIIFHRKARKSSPFLAFNILRMNHPFWLKISGQFTDCQICLWAKFQVKIPSFDFSDETWSEVGNPVK